MPRSSSRSVIPRSYLYAPGHDPRRLETAFDHGADVVVFDLEDGVPPDRKDEARELVAGALRTKPAWVRVNPAGTAASEADLAAVRGLAAGLRLPKTSSPEDARWLLDRIPGVPVICSIESGQGVVAAPAIAAVPGVRTLSLGSCDLTADLGCADTWDELLVARSALVAACRSAGRIGPWTASTTRLTTRPACARRRKRRAGSGFPASPRSGPRKWPRSTRRSARKARSRRRSGLSVHRTGRAVPGPAVGRPPPRSRRRRRRGPRPATRTASG